MKTLVPVIVMFLWAGVVTAKVHRQWSEESSPVSAPVSWTIPDGAAAVTVEACVSMDGPKDSRGVDRCSWELTLVLADSTEHAFTVGWGNTDFGDFSDRRYLEVRGLAEPVRLTEGADMYSGDNTLVVETDVLNIAHVYVGNDILSYVGDVALKAPLRKVRLSSQGRMSHTLVAIESEIPENLESGLDAQALAEACRPGQPAPLGLWHYLDRDNDMSYARPGGTYSLAIVPDAENEGHYLVLYVDGAIVNAHGWHQGMIKGRMRPTMFTGRYRLEWWDARMERVSDEANVMVEDNILTLNFPLLHSQLRFSR